MAPLGLGPAVPCRWRVLHGQLPSLWRGGAHSSRGRDSERCSPHLRMLRLCSSTAVHLRMKNRSSVFFLLERTLSAYKYFTLIF